MNRDNAKSYMPIRLSAHSETAVILSSHLSQQKQHEFVCRIRPSPLVTLSSPVFSSSHASSSEEKPGKMSIRCCPEILGISVELKHNSQIGEAKQLWL